MATTIRSSSVASSRQLRVTDQSHGYVNLTATDRDSGAQVGLTVDAAELRAALDKEVPQRDAEPAPEPPMTTEQRAAALVMPTVLDGLTARGVDDWIIAPSRVDLDNMVKIARDKISLALGIQARLLREEAEVESAKTKRRAAVHDQLTALGVVGEHDVVEDETLDVIIAAGGITVPE